MRDSDATRVALSRGALLGVLACVVWGGALLHPSAAAAQGHAGDASGTWLSVAETEELVRAHYYEGLPEEAARRIGAEGCERLLELLADPAEAEFHGQILLAMGMCAPEGAFEAMNAWADQPRSGAVDRGTYRAWQMLPFAMAYLAEEDARALADLEERLEPGSEPHWHFRHHRGARLVNERQRAAASCLAETGLPEAREALDRAGRRASDPEFRAHLENARAEHAQAVRRRASRLAVGGGGQ